MLNFLMPIIIVFVITVLIFAMIKYKNPLAYAVFAIVISFGGIYSSFVCYEFYTQTSEVRGSLQEVDPYENFDVYNVDIEGIAWHYDFNNNIYYLERTYNTAVDFDGTGKQFNVLINGQPCDSVKTTAGKLRSTTNLYIKDVDGNYIDTIHVILNMTFYSNKVVITIQTNANTSNITYLQQYCQINGLDIRILDSIGNHFIILTKEPV